MDSRRTTSVVPSDAGGGGGGGGGPPDPRNFLSPPTDAMMIGQALSDPGSRPVTPGIARSSTNLSSVSRSGRSVRLGPKTHKSQQARLDDRIDDMEENLQQSVVDPVRGEGDGNEGEDEKEDETDEDDDAREMFSEEGRDDDRTRQKALSQVLASLRMERKEASDDEEMDGLEEGGGLQGRSIGRKDEETEGERKKLTRQRLKNLSVQESQYKSHVDATVKRAREVRANWFTGLQAVIILLLFGFAEIAVVCTLLGMYYAGVATPYDLFSASLRILRPSMEILVGGAAISGALWVTVVLGLIAGRGRVGGAYLGYYFVVEWARRWLTVRIFLGTIPSGVGVMLAWFASAGEGLVRGGLCLAASLLCAFSVSLWAWWVRFYLPADGSERKAHWNTLLDIAGASALLYMGFAIALQAGDSVFPLKYRTCAQGYNSAMPVYVPTSKQWFCVKVGERAWLGRESEGGTTEVSCTTTYNSAFGFDYQAHMILCPSGCIGQSDNIRVVGCGVYTSDSAMCLAAINAGALDDAGGETKVLGRVGAETYETCSSNSVDTESLTPSSASDYNAFTFDKGDYREFIQISKVTLDDYGDSGVIESKPWTRLNYTASFLVTGLSAKKTTMRPSITNGITFEFCKPSSKQCGSNSTGDPSFGVQTQAAESFG
uniref:LCCL domain-containing protein n=1 Tax=Chromera velia CCMP2878 TaxID=1169474 RepID=A0A0G4HJB5_9ALVE|eukprot:Cvel_7070.t1-p1 / transcript=Cvel_7070.t1 / gene=Cvel_7070 / organism=Chromera_velia_CCMP2878 / gene_product=hypothetical protein / transcript_product=hypothetical protein / location=Cvel_scaffold361:74830-84075(-) / protein_length=658 / sequence_SO=supercontig / SO=protein_coding / is_pseudo=false